MTLLADLAGSWLHQLLPALQSPVGAAVFIPLYALWVTLLLPGVWASMLAGALYGSLFGSGLVFVGASLGAIASFLIGGTGCGIGRGDAWLPSPSYGRLRRPLVGRGSNWCS